MAKSVNQTFLGSDVKLQLAHRKETQIKIDFGQGWLSFSNVPVGFQGIPLVFLKMWGRYLVAANCILHMTL